MSSQAKDNTFNKTLKKAYAYAILPEVGKSGFIVGASHGAEAAGGGQKFAFEPVGQVVALYPL